MAPSETSDASRLNREYYDQLSLGQQEYWKKMAAPRHRVATMTSELIKLAPKTVADLGCGDGSLLAEIGKRLPAAKCAGLDLSEEQISQNRTNRPDLDWHCVDLDQPIEKDGPLADRFEAVVAMEVIEHLDNPAVFLRNALEVVVPNGGSLLLSTQSGPLRETERRVGHRRHFEATEMRDLLTKSGWHPLHVWTTGFPFHDLSKWYANINPDATMARFGERSYGWQEDLVCALLRFAFRFNSNRYGAQLFALASRN
jgi:2-polyprenyl-3-methyl-5-hydroxy-6-metoxy-1,4-benzoquinol methylase